MTKMSFYCSKDPQLISPTDCSLHKPSLLQTCLLSTTLLATTNVVANNYPFTMTCSRKKRFVFVRQKIRRLY